MCELHKQLLTEWSFVDLFVKVVSQYSSLLSPLAVDAVMKVIDPATATNVDLRDIKIVKRLG